MVSIRWRLPDGAGVQRERELARHFVGVGAEAAQVRDRLLAQNLSWPKGLARGLSFAIQSSRLTANPVCPPSQSAVHARAAVRSDTL